jgi:hypothetical protein
MEIYALDSSEAETLYPLPTKYNEAIGGWWLTCYRYIGHPFIHPWKVSPRIGLNGFYIVIKATGFAIANKVTNFIC